MDKKKIDAPCWVIRRRVTEQSQAEKISAAQKKSLKARKKDITLPRPPWVKA